MLVDISDAKCFYFPSQALACSARLILAGDVLASVRNVILYDLIILSMLARTSDMICLSFPSHASANLSFRADFMRRSVPRFALRGDKALMYLGSFLVALHNYIVLSVKIFSEI